ncbi:preprotein translocase subunit SecG [Gammaproteobacteria bacterium]
MQTILTVFHLFISIGLIGLVLVQHGRGADAGAAFGSGASATVFGARGAANFLSRTTAILAALFFMTSMALAYFSSQTGKAPGLMDQVSIPAKLAPPPVGEVPVVPEEKSALSSPSKPVPSVPPPMASPETPPAPPPPVLPEKSASTPVPMPAVSEPPVAIETSKVSAITEPTTVAEPSKVSAITEPAIVVEPSKVPVREAEKGGTPVMEQPVAPAMAAPSLPTEQSGQ